MTGRDTIAAISTPPGIGGIGLIRISGTEAEGIARRLFRTARPIDAFLSHHLYHGEIVAPETGAVLDDVLIAFLRGPHTYTGEDTLEISCHGGPLILRTVLAEVLRAGARPAERGEFTKRAFLNGRLDLSQAEAVFDLISAKTPEGLSAAVDRLKGKLSGRIETIRNAIIDLLAGIEAAIDFAEDDGVVEAPGANLLEFQAVIDDLHALAATYRRGRIIREGIGVVIAGRPNVGKSSLLNRILGEKRAIVTPIPGTTRDFIEETVNIGGIPVRLTDTAGIRPPENAIEKEGIDLVWERLVTTDAILVLLDGSMALTPEDQGLLLQMHAKPMIPVINKSDLPQRLDEALLRGLLPAGTPPAVRISAKYGDGIDRLTAAIHEMILATPAEETPAAMIADLRHKIALERAAECLDRAQDGLRDGLPSELAALEVREALDSLGEITGRTTSEEVLDRIFANFCVGK
ncbi:MAG: tRNA uridine-5-carboxymethylaminomethyl(34) synthesis GTPase MnmE [Syntrophus sp. (in: bacteria)]|nr:tRNA uridine-5-carboxymethylaminomethyl(34) synthesis GTPase MnmE [Syntrophus sp. (in: bacteria)]